LVAQRNFPGEVASHNQSPLVALVNFGYSGPMKFELPTTTGVIHKRYKRFMSDIELPDGEMVVAHVPNTGSMKTCWEPNWKAVVTKTDDPNRKLKYTLQMTHNGDSWIGVNTSLTNKLVHEALENDVIEELTGYTNIKPEKKVLDSRIDFFLSEGKNKDAYVEVKNVTLLGKPGQALFPDSVSTRGQKHLKDLTQLVQDGHRAVMLYVVNREDVKTFSPADEIDPKYGELLREAHAAGVEVLAYQCELSPKEVKLIKPIKVEL
jgi:sugar fermentation stimulation protein A